VYYKGNNVTPLSAQTLGYDVNDGNTDIAIQPYPSDHRAVVVEFDMPSCISLADVNGNCAVNSADWVQFRQGQHLDMSGFTLSQAWANGDLTGDFKNNHADFVIFKNAYDDANGGGSFAGMLNGIPEPSGLVFAVWALCAWPLVARYR
jgi:hypothetical protein